MSKVREMDADVACALPACTTPGGKWCQCNNCEVWYHFTCLGWLQKKEMQNEMFYCSNCNNTKQGNNLGQMMKMFAESQIQTQKMFLTSLQAPKLVLEAPSSTSQQASTSKDAWKREIGMCDLLPTFAGKEYEDPKEFYSKCETILSQENVTKSLWVHFLSRQLKEDALDWWKSQEVDIETPESFERKITQKYDHITILANLRASYYGQKQSNSMPTQTCLSGKMRLHKRLFPYETEPMAIPYLVEMLQENIRPFLRNPLPATFEDLLRGGNQRQHDLDQKPSKQDQAVTCFRCGDPGHFSRQCPQVRGNTFQGMSGNGYPERK
jgi:Zinc knuckle